MIFPSLHDNDDYDRRLKNSSQPPRPILLRGRRGITCLIDVGYKMAPKGWLLPNAAVALMQRDTDHHVAAGLRHTTEEALVKGGPSRGET